MDHSEPCTRTIGWTDPDLKEIIRIRFIADRYSGPWDLSYCHGRDQQGLKVRVQLPVYQVHGKGGAVVWRLVEAAKADGIYLRGLCGGNIEQVLSLCW